MRNSLYIKKYAQSLIASLAQEWTDSNAMELMTTLVDYKNEKARMAMESAEPKPVKDDAVKLRDCEGNKIYQRFFDFFMKESAAGKNPIVVWPHDVQLSYQDLVKWSNRINTSNYKKLYHKDCNISKFAKTDCVEFTLTRKEQA